MGNSAKVHKIVKQLNKNLDMCDFTRYKIIEDSMKHERHAYIVHNLEAEVEDGEVYFGDIEEIIFSNQFALMGFLVRSIKDIIFTDNVIDIIFETNSIKIELIA